MNVAIIGSRKSRYHQARAAMDKVESALFGHFPGEVQVATFIHGGVHQYALDLAAARRWPASKFRSVHAMIKWSPDECIILWDGQSLGCLAVLEHMTAAKVRCWTCLMGEEGDVDLLGTNADAISGDYTRASNRLAGRKDDVLDHAERSRAHAA